jgi:ATP-dependent DNA helicase RecQ
VVSDIAALLELDQPAIFKKSFVRENLIYVVQEEHHKLNRMIGAVKNLGGSGIVYVGTRRETVRQANLLRANNIGALPYHGGMSREDRKRTQEMWINNKAAVVVATNAFGMGIDKPDVRFVIHLDLPASPEAYFQEAGRAGRDGKRAYAVCLVNEEDRLALKERVERQIPHKKDIKTVFRALVNYFQLATGSSMEGEHPFNLVAFSKRYNLEPANTLNCLKVLQEEEYVHLTDAVFNPSKVQALQNTKDLYSFEIGHPKFEPIIRVLLRSYEGLFDQPVRIDEMALARRLKSNYGKVREMLEYLAQMRVISYRPHTDLPFISFPVQRPSVERLKLDDKALKARQNRLLSKMQAILRYSRNDIVCRSRQLVSYFGDYSASDCGKCDVCLAKKKIQSEKELNPNLFAEIKSSLQDNPKSLEEISQIPGFKSEEISNALRWLNDNGEIQIDLENVVSKAH